MSEPKFESAVRGTAPLPAPQLAAQPGLTEAVSFSAATQNSLGVVAAPAAPPRVIKAEARASAPGEALVPVADIPEAPGWALVLVVIALAAWFLRSHG
jgi:hypothetical protein